MKLQRMLAVHTMLRHDRTKEEPLRNVPQLRRPGSQGASERHDKPANRDHRATRRAAGAPRPESFCGDRPGRKGIRKKATLIPCAVHTACYCMGMNSVAINNRIANLNSMISEINSEIAHAERVVRARFASADIDGTLAAQADLAALVADRQAIYDLWNEDVAA